MVAECPYVAQAIVVGHARRYCSMLLALDAAAIEGWAGDGRGIGLLATAPDVRELLDGYVTRLNARLNRWETIKTFTVLPREMTVETGELTPSMKIRRTHVTTTYATLIEQMYAGGHRV
jgi:long-chain acyl-CoA synthetase